MATIYYVEVQKETPNGTVTEKEFTIDDDVPYHILHQKMQLKAASDLNSANIFAFPKQPLFEYQRYFSAMYLTLE